MRVVRKRKNRFSLARNWCRANTYAAGTPTTSESRVEPDGDEHAVPHQGRVLLAHEHFRVVLEVGLNSQLGVSESASSRDLNEVSTIHR